MVHIDKCPLCSSTDLSVYLRCMDHLVSGEEFVLVKCRECGFIFTQDHPDEKNIGIYYQSDDYVSHNDQAAGFANRIYLVARSIMLVRKRKITEKVTGLKSGDLLDIGCGTGYYAGEMKKAGWNVKGIEPNPRAGKFASEKFGIRVLLPESIDTLPDSSLDCITMWHVLEHFQDPFSYAGEIKRLLRPGGVCLCALPNSSSFDAEYYKESWAAHDCPRHLWHFTPDTFRIFAEKNGFVVTGIQALPLDVFYISMLSEKNRGNKFSFLSGAVKGLYFALRSVFNRQRSSSLIYFLRKKN